MVSFHLLVSRTGFWVLFQNSCLFMLLFFFVDRPSNGSILLGFFVPSLPFPCFLDLFWGGVCDLFVLWVPNGLSVLLLFLFRVVISEGNLV